VNVNANASTHMNMIMNIEYECGRECATQSLDCQPIKSWRALQPQKANLWGCNFAIYEHKRFPLKCNSL